MKMLIDVVEITINELKECWARSKNAETKKEKAKYLSLVYLNVLFFPVYLIPVLYTITVIAGTFIYGPIVLLGLLFSIPFLIFVALIKLKAYPTMKSNYLSK